MTSSILITPVYLSNMSDMLLSAPRSLLAVCIFIMEVMRAVNKETPSVWCGVLLERPIIPTVTFHLYRGQRRDALECTEEEGQAETRVGAVGMQEGKKKESLLGNRKVDQDRGGCHVRLLTVGRKLILADCWRLAALC